MPDGTSGPVPRPAGSRSRWTSFVAGDAAAGKQARALHEAGNPAHRLRVEHDQHTLLLHLCDEDGRGWTTVAIDRGSQGWSIAQRDTQRETARAAYDALYA